MKIIIGAGGTTQAGWTSFEFNDLDIRRRDNWLRLFQPGTVEAVLAEHVLEHLNPDEAAAAARNIYEFLRPGGYWRIAVPDAYNPDPRYHEWSSPTGRFQSVWQPFFYDQKVHPAHNQFFSIDSLTLLLDSAGFNVKPLEWFDRGGQFQQKYLWPSPMTAGQIYRANGTQHVASMRFVLPFDNISLIVDAVK